MIIRRSRKAEVYWWWLRKCTVWVQLIPWWWTPITSKVWLESALTYNCNFVAYLGYRNITFFHIGRLWGFKRLCQALFMLCVFVNPQFQHIYMEPAEVPSNVISFQNLNLEISKGRDLLVKIWKICARAAKSASCKVRFASPVAPVTDCIACPYWPATSRGMFSWIRILSPTWALRTARRRPKKRCTATQRHQRVGNQEEAIRRGSSCGKTWARRVMRA
jgi:hypothetical protein